MRNRKFLWIFLIGCLSLFAAEAQTRILPFGDSVTSSFAPYSSYRYWLWHKLVDAGYDVDFVGTQSGVADGNPGNGDFDQDHEGHPGWTTQDGAENIGWIASLQPDIVLLDLGANDVQDGVWAQDTATNLINIIEGFRAVNPNVVILMAQPTPFAGQNQRAMSRLRYVIKRVAKLERQAGSPVSIVNLASGFNVRKDTFDGTHLDESGERKIANRWFSALRQVLH